MTDKEWQHAYYLANRERKHAYYLANRDWLLARQRAKKRKRPYIAKRAAYQHAYYRANKERLAAYKHNHGQELKALRLANR